MALGAIEKNLPFPTQMLENPVTDSVTTTIGLIARGNANRFQLVIINTGGNDVFIGFHADVTQQKAFRLGANGGTFIMKYYEDAEALYNEFYAFTLAGVSTVYVLDFVRRS